MTDNRHFEGPFTTEQLPEHEHYAEAIAVLCEGRIVTHKVTRRWIGPRPLDPEKQRERLESKIRGMGDRYFVPCPGWGYEKFPADETQIVGRIFFSTEKVDCFDLALDWFRSIGEHPINAEDGRIPEYGVLSPRDRRILGPGEFELQHPYQETWDARRKKEDDR